MSRTYKDSPKGRSAGTPINLRDRRTRKRDLRKISRAVIKLVMAQTEVEAETLSSPAQSSAPVRSAGAR